MAHHTVEEKSLSLSPTDKFYKFYAIFGTLIVIVKQLALISFAFFDHGLTSDALLGNGNIEIESKFIELNVRNTIKNAEILGYIVEQHLLATKKETHSEIMSIRRTEEHAKEKEGNLKKRKERLSEIQDKLKAINKMRSKNTTDLKENGESLVKNKSLIKKAERYLNDSVWLSIFSVSVMLLGGLIAKVGFKRWNELSAADYY